MKRTHQGTKVQNWHRPLAAGRLGTRFRRLRDQVDPSAIDLAELAVCDCCDCRYADDAPQQLDTWWEQEDEAWRRRRRQTAADQELRQLLQDVHCLLRPNDLVLALANGLTAPARSAARVAALEDRLADHELWLREHLGQGELVAGELLAAMPHGADLIAIDREANRRGRPDLVLALMLFAPFWRRRPAAWSGPAAGAESQPDLVEFVLGDHPIPRPLLAQWYGPTDRARSGRWLRYLQWSVLFAQGGSLRIHANRLGSSLPRLFQHNLANAPTTLDATEAMHRAEVHAVGGADGEVELLQQPHALCFEEAVAAGDFGTPVDARFAAFRTATIAWLARHRGELTAMPMASRCNLVAWAAHMQAEAERQGNEFSWRGVTVASATRRAELYLHAQRFSLPPVYTQWPARGFAATLQLDGVAWDFVELTKTEELVAESAQHDHCVRTYGDRCVNAISAIVSLRIGGTPTLTIEMSVPTRQPVQIRGARNRQATSTEMSGVQRWLALLGQQRPSPS